MSEPAPALHAVQDNAPDTATFQLDVLQGLRAQPRILPPKYFYDERGSALFDEICDLEEYYPTRAEIAILREHAAEMGAMLGPDCLLIEYGIGSGLKTRMLLDHVLPLAAFVPIDISCAHLQRAAAATAAVYPSLPVLPVCADFTQPYTLPMPPRPAQRRAVYFPGSTIGNFTRAQAATFLTQIAQTTGPGGGALIGVDLKKDRERLERAYNDTGGVTAAFNLNLLQRINTELDGEFSLDAFAHRAFYNASAKRIEMHLESLRDQTVRVGAETFAFRAGETICTEYSHKYSLEEFAALAEGAGLHVGKVWTDPAALFSVQYLTVR